MERKQIMSSKDALIVYVLCALITYFYRAFPFLFFKDGRLPSWLDRCRDLLPSAFMAILVVYCMKGTVTATIMENLISDAGVIVTVVIHAYKRKTILSVVCGTTVYILLLNLI